jgi:hypothetical protein
VSQISDPNNAIQRIAQLLLDKEDPDDPGVLSEAGEALLDVAAVMAKKVRQTGKACKGEVTIKLPLKAYRTKNNEVAVEIEPVIGSKKPQLARDRGVMLFAGHDGELSTTAVQEEMPLFTKESARVVPGVGNDDAANAASEGKKGKKAI